MTPSDDIENHMVLPLHKWEEEQPEEEEEDEEDVIVIDDDGEQDQ